MKLNYSFLACLLFMAISPVLQGQTTSLVTIGSNEKLVYTPDSKGNIIPDYSAVGYKNGAQAIPTIPTKVVLTPVSGDNRSRIQAAIDNVSTMSPDANGFRGAVLLKAGEYKISNTIYIKASGVVLRGVGNSTSGTRLVANRKSKHDLIKFVGNGGISINTATSKKISGSYIPTGAKSFTVANGHSFSVGDRVILRRKPNQAWIKMLGMDKLSQTDPGDYNWTPGQYTINYKRTVTAVSGNNITIDAPVVDPIDSKYAEGFLMKYSWSKRIENVGIEKMRLSSTYTSNTDENHGWNAITYTNTEHGWATNIVTYYFGYSAVNIGRSSSNISVLNSKCFDPKSKTTGGRKYSFNVDGERNLVKNCTARGGRHDYVTGGKVAGPNAFVYCTSTNQQSDIGPHHRWGTGMLFDNIYGDKEQNVQNRVNMGTGHGWAGAQTMYWNCKASKMIHQSPPNHTNWAIGCIANITDQGPRHKRNPGLWQSTGTHIKAIPSLYERQLCERLGKAACGGGSNPDPNPTCEPVTASGDDGNIPESVLDGKLGTRWSMNGLDQWIQFCLEKEETVTGVNIAFFKGNERESKFNIESSLDGADWKDITNKMEFSSGKSLEFENFPFAPIKAKYIRIVGQGNTINLWNSYTEVEIIKGTTTNLPPIAQIAYPANNDSFTAPATISITANAYDQDGSIKKVDFYNEATLLGTVTAHPYTFDWKNAPVGTHILTVVATDNSNETKTSDKTTIHVKPPTPSCQPVTAIGNDGNVPENVLDGSLLTRWSMNGLDQHIQFCLEKEETVTGVNIAFFKGNERQSKFDIKSSSDGATWKDITTTMQFSSGKSLELENFSFTPIKAKYIRIVGQGTTINLWNSYTEVTIDTAATPIPDFAHSIPGTIECEDYKPGEEGIAYHDTTPGNAGNAYKTDNVDIEATIGGGHNIGWVKQGEWLTYDVKVTTDGLYTIEARVAAISAARSFRIELNNKDISGSVAVPNTGGWQTWTTVSVSNISLKAGVYVMRIFMETDSFNMDSVKFIKTSNALRARNSQAPKLVAVPNPADDGTLISLPNNHSGVTIFVINETKKIISTQSVKPNVDKVYASLKDIPGGLYFIKVNTRQNSQTLKVIKK